MAETKRTPWRCLLQRVRELVAQRQSATEEFEELNNLLNQAQEVTAKRNDIIHSIWAEHDGKIVVRGDHGVEPRSSILDLNSLADELGEIAAQLETSRLTGALGRVTGRIS